jgi:hypothetical protein
VPGRPKCTMSTQRAICISLKKVHCFEKHCFKKGRLHEYARRYVVELSSCQALGYCIRWFSCRKSSQSHISRNYLTSVVRVPHHFPWSTAFGQRSRGAPADFESWRVRQLGSFATCCPFERSRSQAGNLDFQLEDHQTSSTMDLLALLAPTSCRSALILPALTMCRQRFRRGSRITQ